MTCQANLLRELHVGDVGTEIRISLTDEGEPVDLTGATVQILLKGSNGVLKTKAATVVGEATSGVVHCYTASGDLAAAGKLEIQVKIASTSWTGHSQKIETRVYPTLSP